MGEVRLGIDFGGTKIEAAALDGAGQRLDGPSIIAAARAGDRRAQETFDRYVDRLGRTLAMTCNVLDPDTIVLGGGLSNIAELYVRLPDKIRAYVFSDVWNGRVVAARWGDSSGVRGAAQLYRSTQMNSLPPT